MFKRIRSLEARIDELEEKIQAMRIDLRVAQREVEDAKGVTGRTKDDLRILLEHLGLNIVWVPGHAKMISTRGESE